MMSIFDKKGSMAVEASILLPIVILGILTIAYIININSLTENVMSISADESRRVAINSYSDLGKGYSLIFPAELKKRLKEENSHCQDISVSDYRYLYSKEGQDNLISFKVDYSISTPLGMGSIGRVYLQETITTRAFVGKSKYENQEGYELMSKDEESCPVWIFPDSGTKYHGENCRYLKAAACKKGLTRDIRNRYKPCKLCGAKGISDGQWVYCFMNSGGAYHKKTCKTVDKYVVEVEKQVAIDKGYMPCSVCGGGG